MNVTELRLGLLAHGFDPLPITNPDAPGKDAGKAPRLLKWQTIEITPDAIRGWEHSRRPETNTGLRCGHLIALDIDVLDGGLVHRLRNLASDTIGPTPLVRIGQTPKTLLAYRADVPFPKVKSRRLIMPDGQPALIECLATGQQFVGFGIHPVTRQPYHWANRSPLDVALADLPALTATQACAFVAEAESLLRAAGGHPEDKHAAASARPCSRASRPPSAWPAPTRQDVCDALKAVPNTVDWHWWIKIGAALFDALADDGEDLFVQWSAQSSKDDPEYTRRKWRSLRTSPMTTTAASLFWLARQNGWRPAAEREDQKALRKETARAAFRLLRKGVASTELLAALHKQNRSRPDPLPACVVDDTAIWAARRAMERAHAQ